jgi:two-component system cell cycle sensor histidine kinase PleC
MSSSGIAEEVARLEGRRDARKRAAADLKETRARLAAGTSIKPEFEYELLAMFVRSELGAAVTIPALYALFAIASMFWARSRCHWLAGDRHRRQGRALPIRAAASWRCRHRR